VIGTQPPTRRVGDSTAGMMDCRSAGPARSAVSVDRPQRAPFAQPALPPNDSHHTWTKLNPPPAQRPRNLHLPRTDFPSMPLGRITTIERAPRPSFWSSHLLFFTRPFVFFFSARQKRILHVLLRRTPSAPRIAIADATGVSEHGFSALVFLHVGEARARGLAPAPGPPSLSGWRAEIVNWGR